MAEKEGSEGESWATTTTWTATWVPSEFLAVAFSSAASFSSVAIPDLACSYAASVVDVQMSLCYTVCFP